MSKEQLEFKIHEACDTLCNYIEASRDVEFNQKDYENIGKTFMEFARSCGEKHMLDKLSDKDDPMPF